MLIDIIILVYDQYFLTLKLQEKYNILFSNAFNSYNEINNIYIKKQAKMLEYTQTNDFTHNYTNNEEKNNEEKKNEALKQIYKKLSKVIHPDKNNKNSHMFIKCKEAYDKKNISELIYISCMCNMKDIHISLYLEKIINIELNEIKQKTNELKSTVCWKWNIGNNNEKEHIINIIKDI